MENLLALQIRNLNNDFCHPALNILSLIQIEQADNIDLIFHKLQCFFSDLSVIRDILQNASSIAAESPLASFKVFYEKMPNISLDPNSKQPEFQNYDNFLSYIRSPKPIDWSNPLIRIGMSLYTEILIAVFCLEIVEIADFSKKKNEAQLIFDRIMRIITSKLDNPVYNRFRTISAAIWSEVIYYISKVDPTPFSKMNEFLMNSSNSQPDDQKAIYLELYSKVYFRDVHKIDKSIKKQLTEIRKKANKAKTSNFELHVASFKFLANYIGNLCFSDSSFQNPKTLIDEFLPKSKLFHSPNSGPILVFYAYLIVFTCKDQQAISSKIRELYYPHVQDPAYANYILKSFIIFLRGFNYQGIYKNREQYAGPHIITNRTFINEMFDKIYDNSSIYSLHSSLMTEFLAQIAVSDINGFIDTKLPNKIFLDHSSFLSENYTAVFDAARIFVHPAYNFPIDDDQRANLIELFRKEACGLIKKYNPTSEVNWPKVVTLLESFSVKSFVESVILHQKDMNVIFYYNQIESRPRLYVRPNRKLKVSNVVQNWKKIFKGDLKKSKIFISDDHPVPTYHEDLVHESILPSAICIIPLAYPSITTFDDLMIDIYTESVDVAAASLRAIQAMIFIDKSKEIVHAIYSKIDSLISKRMISSNQALYRTLYSLYLMLDAIVYTEAPLTEQSVDLFNITSVIGFCSASYDIRLIGYNIGKLIESKTPKLSVSTVFDQNAEQILFLTRINSLAALSYKNYSTADSLTINALGLLQSEFSVLYQFELAAFAYFLKMKLDQSSMNDIRLTILNVLNSTKMESYIDPLFIMNLIIFLVNTCTSKDYSTVKSLINLFVKIMNKSTNGVSNNQKYEDAPYFPLLSQIDQQICINLITDYDQLPKQLMLPLMFALRRHIDSENIKFTNTLISRTLLFLESILPVFAPNDEVESEPKGFSYTKLIFNAPSDPNTCIKEQLISFLQISEIILEFLKFNNQRNPANTFLRVPIFDKESEGAHMKINSKAWYIFLLNIASLDNDLGTIAKKTLTSFMYIFEISQDIYSKLFNRISMFEIEPLVINALLTQGILYMEYSYQFLLFEHVVNEAHTNSNYFKAISTLYIDAKSSDIAINTIQEALRNTPYKSEERMFDITYKHSGSLLALAFYYILLHDGEVRAAGFRVLQAISLGLTVSQNKVLPKLCHLIDEIRPHIIISRHSNVALEPCIRLSNLLAREFPFISGQFAYSLFSLIEKERSLSHILLPWIARVRLSSSDKYEMVLTKTSREFSMFTTDSFVNCLLKLPATKSVLDIISKAIKEQTEDSLDVLEYLLMKILSSHLNRPDIANRYKTIIVYLYTLYPQKVLRILFQILSYDFWHYRDIQINKFDALLDVTKFLQEAARGKVSAQSSRDANNTNDKIRNENDSIMVSDADDSDSDSDSDSDDDNDVYDVTVKFVLDIFEYCINEQIEPFQPYIPDLALFSFVNIHKYAQTTINLLSKLLLFDPTDDLLFNKYISSLDDIVKAKLSVSSLAWGLCCGEFDLALNGLAFFTCIGLDVTSDIVDAILKTLYVVSECLYEKTHKIQRKTWLYQIVDVSKEPDYGLAANYLENLLHILSLSQPRDDVFWTLASMLNLNGSEYACVLNAVISLITKMFGKSEFANHISKSPKPENFLGLIPMIVNCTFDQNTPALFFDLFKILDSLPDEQKKIGYNVDDPKYLFSFISNTISGIQLESKDSSFSAHTIGKMPVDDLNVILKLLTHIIVQMKQSNLTLVYDICTQILATKVSDAYVSTLVRVVNLSKNSANFYSYNELMKAADKHGSKICQDQLNGHSFPELSFHDDFAKMIEEEQQLNPTSVFASIETFPPMMSLDTGFLMCPVISKVKTNVERVLAQPFSNWSDLIFKCRLIQSPISERNIDENEMAPFPKIPVETFTKWLHEFTNFVYEDDDDDKESLINQDNHNVEQHNGDTVQEEQPYNLAINIIDLFDANDFLPESSVIEDIGTKEILKDHHLPHILPA